LGWERATDRRARARGGSVRVRGRRARARGGRLRARVKELVACDSSSLR